MNLPPLRTHPLTDRWRTTAVGTRGAQLFSLSPHVGGQLRGAPRHLLLVPGLIQNRFSFSLPTVCAARALAADGFYVHILELMGRDGQVRRRTDGVRAYAQCDIVPALEVVARRAGPNGLVGYIGHSMGGVLGALLPNDCHDRLAAFVALASPLFIDVGAPSLNRVFQAARRGLGPALRRGLPFDGRWLRQPFLRAQRLMDARGARFPFQMWVPKSLLADDLRFFLAHSFVQDSLVVVDELLDANKQQRLSLPRLPDALPTLMMGGNADRLATPDGVIAFADAVGGRGTQLRILGDENRAFGHVDLLVGRHAVSAVWGPVRRFLDDAMRHADA